MTMRMTTTMTMGKFSRGYFTCSRLLVVLLIAISSYSVQSEIRPLELLLEPTSSYVHYIEGFLSAPGVIDLSDLHFKTVGDSMPVFPKDETVGDDLYVVIEGDDLMGLDDDGFEFPHDDEGDNGGNRRILTVEDDDVYSSGSTVDIAVFYLPSSCSNTRAGCNWADLGIGAKNDTTIRYCCSTDAIAGGYCPGSQYGTLIMDQNQYSGSHRFLSIPASGDFDGTIRFADFEQDENTGKYVVVLANCNDGGRPILVTGKTIWKSDYGFLPANLLGLMYFYVVLFVVYFALMIWYGITMRAHEESAIPLQSWIFGNIAMGCLELFFLTGDLFVWNEDGARFWLAWYIGVLVGVLKGGVSRCLMLMVSLGWGVVTDDLGDKMKQIVGLGSLYVIAAVLRDVMTVIAKADVQQKREEQDDELMDIATILAIVVAVVDVIFLMWIVNALNETMEYLETMGQQTKLRRFLRLRLVIIFCIMFAAGWAVFGIVDSVDEGILQQEQEWFLDGFVELNYLFVLIAVAVLWRPSPNAKDYAYVMELPSGLDDDDDLDDDGVELSDVPSAAEHTIT